MLIIDVHTHVPPQKHWRRFLDEMDASGISLSITSALGITSWPYFPSSAELSAFNDYAKAFSEFSRGRVLWLAYINPMNDNALSELDRCIDMGCLGVKLWVSLKSPETGLLDRCAIVLKAIADRQLPVKIHTFHTTGGNIAGSISLHECAELARQCPECRILAAHAGANWHQSHGVLDGLPNVWMDVSGCMAENGMVESLCRWYGAERVMFGSDADGRSMKAQLEKVLCARITDIQKAQILSSNALSFWNLHDVHERSFPVSTPLCQALYGMTEDNTCILDWDERTSGNEKESFISELHAAGYDSCRAVCQSTLYAEDLIEANQSFKQTCAGFAEIKPLATVIPSFYNWREILDAAQEFPGMFLSPYLHNWALNDKAYLPFFRECAKKNIPVWIHLEEYENRFHHPGHAVRNVTPAEITDFLQNAPQNRYTFIETRSPQAEAVLSSVRDDVFIDVTRLVDNTGALQDILNRFGASRLVMGSGYPRKYLPWTRRLV